MMLASVVSAVVDLHTKSYSDFEKEAVPHIDALYNFALRMTGNQRNASDLLQETYLSAFRFYDKLETGINCRNWLFRIMRNTYIDIYREKSKEPQKVDFDELENFYKRIKESSAEVTHLEKEIYDNLSEIEISDALSSLPEDFRAVIILHDIEGFNYEEIADFIDCPIGIVRSRLYKARKMLFTKIYKYSNVLV